jgi:hypothetical protein
MSADKEPLDEQFQQWIDLYNKGEITPAEFVSEMEFDGFDGDLTDYL